MHIASVPGITLLTTLALRAYQLMLRSNSGKRKRRCGSDTRRTTRRRRFSSSRNSCSSSSSSRALLRIRRKSTISPSPLPHSMTGLPPTSDLWSLYHRHQATVGFKYGCTLRVCRTVARESGVSPSQLGLSGPIAPLPLSVLMLSGMRRSSRRGMQLSHALTAFTHDEQITPVNSKPYCTLRQTCTLQKPIPNSLPLRC